MGLHSHQATAQLLLLLVLLHGCASLAQAADPPRHEAAQQPASWRIGSSSSSTPQQQLVQERGHQWPLLPPRKQQHDASHRRLLLNQQRAAPPPAPQQQQQQQQQQQPAADALDDAPDVVGDWVAPGGHSTAAHLPWASASAIAPDDQCPGCSPGNCVEAEGGYACQGGCAGGLFLSTSDGTCGCPPGRYGPAASDKACKDCEKTFFCAGGRYTGEGSPLRTPCMAFSIGLTTAGSRASSKRQCVNDQGFFYNVDSTTLNPSASPCGVNSYGPGYKKQRACVPCGDGLSTNGKTQQTSARSCLIGPGYYFSKTANKVLPCPQGEWQSQYGSVSAITSCTRCAASNVVTAAEGATSIRECAVVLPGSFPTAMTADGIVTATARCPQNMLCPGGKALQPIDPSNIPEGDATIRRCPRGLWTKDFGTVTEDQCVVPPGHFLPASGTMTDCADGSYRSGWVPPADAAACTKCSPDGSIFSMATDMLVHFKPDGSESSEAVKGSKGSCYILAGMGLVLNAATQTFTGVNCGTNQTNQWGVSGINFGLDTRFACKSCPANLVTSNNATSNPISASFYVSNGGTPPLGGFTAAGACVTAPGWGVYGKTAQPCPAGTWSAGDTLDTCTPCDYGLTTHPNLTQWSEQDCVLAPGFGVVRNKFIQPCPVGTYNDEIRLDSTSPCTPCFGGATTSVEGAATRDACNLCKPGFAGAECGACGGELGTFSGQGLRPIDEACKDCPSRSSVDGFTFDFGGSENLFAPRIVAASGAVSDQQCFGEFLQVSDGAWNLAMLGAGDWGRPPDTAASVDACVQLCRAEPLCQFLQFNYQKPQGNCQLKVQRSTAGFDLLAFKALASTMIGATSSVNPGSSSSSSSPSRQQRNTSAHAMGVVASGKYSFWRDPTASRTGLTQTDAPMGEPLTWDFCVDACSDDSDCVGVWMQLQAPNVKPAACKLIFGDATPRTFLRAMTRTVPDRMELLDLWPDLKK